MNMTTSEVFNRRVSEIAVAIAFLATASVTTFVCFNLSVFDIKGGNILATYTVSTFPVMLSVINLSLFLYVSKARDYAIFEAAEDASESLMSQIMKFSDMTQVVKKSPVILSLFTFIAVAVIETIFFGKLFSGIGIMLVNVSSLIVSLIVSSLVLFFSQITAK